MTYLHAPCLHLPRRYVSLACGPCPCCTYRVLHWCYHGYAIHLAADDVSKAIYLAVGRVEHPLVRGGWSERHHRGT